MMINTITFQDIEYPIRTLDHPEMGMVNIGSTILNCLLLSDGKYQSNEAQAVDEQIYFFVEAEILNLPDKEIWKVINSSI